ncbi:CehA/McbA family metallohydrolase [Pendulispora rubella]|uniref:CehA/McbA family metallohydrolase n=1 Tax=Pendulispora rubella TaxID=2741070 RepID=A0ABZ2LG99_9BACT
MSTRLPLLAALFVLGAGLPGCGGCRGTKATPLEHVEARVEPLDRPGTAPRVYGRRGDLVLHGTRDTSITVAAVADLPNHRPLRGSILDVGLAGAGPSDPLLWWRAAWVDSGQKLHPLIATEVSPRKCPEGSDGVHIEGDVDAVHLATDLCALADGGYRVTTSATGLPAGATLADDLNPGPADAVIDRVGAEWQGDETTRFVVLAGYGIGVALQATGMRARSRRVRATGTISPAPITLLHEGAEATRILHVVHGDALDALGTLPFATRTARIGLADGRPGFLAVRDNADRVLASGVLPAGGPRTLKLTEGLGETLTVRDADGVPASRAVPIAEAASPALLSIPSGRVALRFIDGRDAPVPVHVIFRGLEGTPDPTPEVTGRAYAGGRSVYLLDGSGTVHLAPGRYKVTATHGPTYSLSSKEIDVAPGGEQTVADRLTAVVDTHEWTAADFHLHSEPSHDSSVSLHARLASLTCEGVDLAVATDHNHVTDYEPVARELNLTSRLATVPGAEITSAGARVWGHFNAFPLPAAGDAAPEEATPPYYEILPRELFAKARAAGARVVQVNHARMPPNIGYFDLAHLDAATGRADADFADDFDALEAYNGFWIESPDRVREGARDLVALARRGRRPIATGNSDSHRLLYEEAGYPRTYVHTPSGAAADRAVRTIDAMLTGDTTVSSGPLVVLTVEGKSPGSVVRPNAKNELRVKVRVFAPAWVPVETIEVWRDDEPVQHFPAGPARDGLRFERETIVKGVDTDATILAWAEARTPLGDVLPNPNARAIGFSGLVYVDADGDGRVNVPSKH